MPYIVQGHQRSSPTSLITDREEKTVFPNGGGKLFHKKDKKNAADSGQVKIVHEESVLQFESRTTPHQFAAREYDGVVGGQKCQG